MDNSNLDGERVAFLHGLRQFLEDKGFVMFIAFCYFDSTISCD